MTDKKEPVQYECRLEPTETQANRWRIAIHEVGDRTPTAVYYWSDAQLQAVRNRLRGSWWER